MTEQTRTIDYGERGRVQIVADPAALARAAADLFVHIAGDAVARYGVATIALSGGSTPKQMGALLAAEPYRSRVDWSNVQIFWGDERWVPEASPESNAGEANRTFLDAVEIPRGNIHAFTTVDIEPEHSARDYEATIRDVIGGGDVPSFDLVLLGMGDDGHTASLFPGTAAIHESERLVVAHDVPKLDATRLTFTPPLINAAKSVVFLAAGAGKATRLAEVLDGPIEVDRLPSQVVRPAGGPLWLVDEAAAASLAKVAG
jgi:6-phosphogluconolactonase